MSGRRRKMMSLAEFEALQERAEAMGNAASLFEQDVERFCDELDEDEIPETLKARFSGETSALVGEGLRLLVLGVKRMQAEAAPVVERYEETDPTTDVRGFDA
jgi:hypothetical protein